MIVSFGLLVVLFAAGVHIGATLALAGMAGAITFTGNWPSGTNLLLLQTMDVSASYTLMVIPLFIVLGTLASASGVTTDLFTCFYRWMGRVSGGVGVAVIATCAGMASITGSSVATAAAMSKIAMPEFRRFNYDERLAVGAIATGGTLSIMIPPSITLVLFALFAEASVGKLLIAGILPGFMIALLYGVMIYVRCRLNPSLGPVGERFTWKERWASLPAVVPFFFIVGSILAGILTGIWTPVESAAVGVVLVILVGFVRHRLTVNAVFQACVDGVITSASVFLVVIGSLVYGQFLALNGFADLMTESVKAMQLSPFALFLLLMVIYFILGCLMEVSSILALTVPLFMPLVALAGWDAVWFGVIVVSMMEVAAVTPPVGLNLYAVKAALPDVSLETIYIGSTPFWIMNVIAVFILYVFPEIALYLPNKM
jgi:tripartite ATP-independent transporter DctM subunit